MRKALTIIIVVVAGFGMLGLKASTKDKKEVEKKEIKESNHYV